MSLTPDAFATDPGKLGKLQALLDRSGIELDDIARVERIRVWQGFLKNDEGEAEVVDLAGLSLIPAWADGPEWPVVQPADPTRISYGKRPNPPKTGERVTFIYPDPQVGYWCLDNGSVIDFEPMHDPVAIECANNVARYVRPWRTVCLGDALDLSEWTSKFLVLPEFANTTQRALNYLHTQLATQRAIVGPEGEVWLFAGNHDDRLGIAVAKNAMAALRLRQANAPESWPVLSMRHLLRLDELGVGYVGAYPAGRLKLADAHGRQSALYAIHGEKLDVAKVAKSERQSYVQGHTHRVGLDTQTYEADGQPFEVEAWMLGCLCRTDGSVPSTKGGVEEDGRPVVRHESWQQACAVLTEYAAGGWSLEPVRIRDGVAHYRGKEITA